uniref:Uncharacterized protein n=1 Tax=Avena sativa TaxID=4498 RepID=A0ACD5Y924_AVESA
MSSWFGRWQELPPELVCRIGDNLDDLKCYVSARGACTAWRSALAPPFPSLLAVPVEAHRLCRSPSSPSAASIAAHRAFELKAIPTKGAQCVGSSNGWLALSAYYDEHIFSLFNPITATEIMVPPLVCGSKWMSKLVFAPNPARDDFAAAAICDMDALAYVTAEARRWAILDPVCLAAGDKFVDLVYHEKEGTVYCLTSYGDVHKLRLPERRRRRESITPSSSPAEHPAADLNASATVEPLLSRPFDPATGFPPPYNTLSGFTSAKNLVFCQGNLYQIWRNTSCTVTLRLPGGGHRRVAENQVFVLRYYPDRQPCWDAVTDLGGYSVFVGRNNAVSMYAQGVPGLKGNCVYWIGGRGRDLGMVFDMATGRSTPCLPPPAASSGAPQTTVCWYFLSDMVN